MATVSRGNTSERLGFIQRYEQDLGVSYLCRWLGVSRSGHCAWLKWPAPKWVQDKKLKTKVRHNYESSRGTYGNPRVYRTLKQTAIAIGRKHVEHLMQAQGLRLVKVTRRQPGLKRFKARRDDLRLD